jgi:hypothetical protein
MIKDILIVLLFAIICVLGFHSCNLEQSGSKQQKDLIEALLENENLKKTIDGKNREITEVKAIILSKDKDIQKALKEIDKLKSLDAKIVFKTRTKYDTINIVLRDTTIIQDTDTIKSQKFDYKDKWLAMSGLVEQDSISFDSLLINNQYSIEIGNIRKGLFKKEKVAFITNENPYSETTQAQTFILKEEKKWYQRDIFKIGLTAIGTFFIVTGL